MTSIPGSRTNKHVRGHQPAGLEGERLDTAGQVGPDKPATLVSADRVVHGGRRIGEMPARMSAASGTRASSLLAVRTTGAGRSGDVIHEIATRKDFDALFAKGASVTAGAPSELKFLVDRKTHEIYFLPPKYPFHFDFYKNVLHGPMDVSDFDAHAYNRPDRDFIAGTVTAYDSYVDPHSGDKGQICFSLWPTDRFDAKLLAEAHDAIEGGLSFLQNGEHVDFRPGGPIQDKLVEDNKRGIEAAGIEVKSNLDISKGLKYMALSDGDAVGRLVVIDKGAAMPALSRKDVALFLGDVPPDAPPVAAIFTTTVQTYNSHLGIKYRQDDTPYFYKSFSDQELKDLKALAGKPVSVACDGKDATVTAATDAQAAAYLKSIKPTGHIRLTPNLGENRARTFDELSKALVGRSGRWDHDALAAYGRKTAGVVELAKLHESGAFAGAGGAGAPTVVAPLKPMGIPANWYTRFIKTAKGDDGVTFSDRIKQMTADPRFKEDGDWKLQTLAKLRHDIAHADMPAELLKDIREQVAAPYIEDHPGLNRARMRSSSPVVEDGGAGKLPNMAGAFDSHGAHWKKGRTKKDTLDHATKAFAEGLQKDYAAVFNDRAVSELQWHNVDLDEESVTMAVLVMPNQENEKANGVIRVNQDLAGFFSVTGETQFGENLVTNPEQGASPDTFIDGNYDVLNGAAKQDIEYERVSNIQSSDPQRAHALTDDEIHAVYDAMHIVRDHFAALEGKRPEEYVDESEIKVLDDGNVMFKQERPWVE